MNRMYSDQRYRTDRTVRQFYVDERLPNGSDGLHNLSDVFVM